MNRNQYFRRLMCDDIKQKFWKESFIIFNPNAMNGYFSNQRCCVREVCTYVSYWIKNNGVMTSNKSIINIHFQLWSYQKVIIWNEWRIEKKKMNGDFGKKNNCLLAIFFEIQHFKIVFYKEDNWNSDW